MFNLLLGFNTNPITVTLVDAVYGATNIINSLFYLIWTLIARVTDFLQIGVEILAGANRTAFGQDIVSIIIQNHAVQSVFWNLVSVCTALMVFFTIIKIIMDQYDSKAKGGNPYKQVFTMFKGMLVYFFITGFVLVAMYASGIIFNALKNATGGGSARVSGIIWQQMAYDANRLRYTPTGNGTTNGGTAGKDGDKAGGYDANDKYHYRLSSDYNNAYTKTAASGNGWDGSKVVLMSLSPDASLRGSSVPYGDELYGWGIKNDDGSVTALNIRPSGAEAEEEVTWSDGTIYDDEMWGNGFADGDAGWGAIAGKYDPASGGWSDQAGGYASTTFNNPMMGVVKANIGVNFDARFQPLYYVEKTFTLSGPEPTMEGNVHITAMGTGAQITFNLTYYKYIQAENAPMLGGYKKLEGSGADVLSIDFDGGMQFGSSGAAASFGISTFTVGYERILAELMMSQVLGAPVDALMTLVSSAGKAFPFGLGLFGVEILSGAPLVQMVVQPLLDGAMEGVSETVADLMKTRTGEEVEVDIKSPVTITNDGSVTIKILRPMMWQEFAAFWVGERLAIPLLPGEVGYGGAGYTHKETIPMWKHDNKQVPLKPKKDPLTGKEIPGEYESTVDRGDWDDELVEFYDVNKNGKFDSGVLGQLTTLNIGDSGDASVPWGTGKSIADLAEAMKETKEEAEKDAEKKAAEYEEQAKKVVAQIQEQAAWAAYTYLLSQYEEAPIGSASGVYSKSLIDNICRYLFNAAFIDEVEEAGYTDLLDDVLSRLGGTATQSLDAAHAQAALKEAIGQATNSVTYRDVTVGNRPSIKALPGILNRENTVYMPASVPSVDGGFILDVHPRAVNGKIYLAHAIDWDAYGHIPTGGNATQTFADGNNLQMGIIDFDKYIVQYMKELSANSNLDDDEKEMLAEIAPRIAQRLYEEYRTPNEERTGDMMKEIVFAEEDVYYGAMRTTDGPDLEDLFGDVTTQSVEEEISPASAPVAEAATQATTYDNSTITFVNLQNEPDQRTALADSVEFLRAVDVNKAGFKVGRYAPIYSLGVDDGGITFNSAATPVAQAAAAIDKLYIEDYATEPNSAYVLALAGVADDGVSLKTQLAPNVEYPGYYVNGPNSRFPLTSEILGHPHYMSMGTLVHCYNIGKMDFMMGFVAIFITLGVYMNFSFGLIQRLLNLAVLYLISPLSIAFYPFDEGAKFKSSFFQPFYKEVTSSYAIILSLNLFFVIFPVVRNAVTETIGAANPVLGLFFGCIAVMSLVSMLPKVRDKVTEVLGAGGLEEKSLGDVYSSAKKNLGSGVASFAGLAKGVGGDAFKVGKGLAAVGRRVGVNSESKFQAKRDAFMNKARENAKASGTKFDEIAAEKAFNKTGTAMRHKAGALVGGAITAPVRGVVAGVKAVGNLAAKTTLGKSIGEAIYVSDGKLGQFVRAHDSAAAADKRKKEGDLLEKRAEAMQDVKGVSYKQVNMAIEKHREAEALLAKSGGVLDDNNKAEYDKAIAARDKALREGGFRGKIADFQQVINAEQNGENYMDVARKKNLFDSRMASAHTVADIRSGSVAAAAMGEMRTNAVISMLNTQPDSVKTAIANNDTVQTALKNNDTAATVAALQNLAKDMNGSRKEGVLKLAEQIELMKGTPGSANAALVAQQMSSTVAKALSDHSNKAAEKLSDSIEASGKGITTAVKEIGNATSANPKFTTANFGTRADPKSMAYVLGQIEKANKSETGDAERADIIKELKGLSATISTASAATTKDIQRELHTGDDGKVTTVEIEKTVPMFNESERQMFSKLTDAIARVEQKSVDTKDLDKLQNTASVHQGTAMRGAQSFGSSKTAGPAAPTGGAGA